MIKFLYVIIMNLFRAPYMIPKMRYQANHPEKYSESTRYHLVRHAIKLMKRTGRIHTKAYGEENLPREGGYVMVPNHQGKYDVLGIMNVHKEPCSFVMDKNKSNTILVREIVDLVQGKRLDKNDVRQAIQVINDMAREVSEGRKYIIFPEGEYEFNNKNQMGTFKPGSFKAAVKAKAPIVPVALIDSYKVFNSFTLGKVTTQVHFLKPLFYEDYIGKKTSEIAEIVRARIAEVLEQYSFSRPY
ncbi:MAG: 1-acyl-sn-glycerol-3-phosphate acyltransferase [Lachnospiraceae bacterium]|nr:1-acyl-sn-glycerol-3-phosphate acyltransferase [Lachnospiraceae bacterium]MCI9149968.1 1-acyl-sn-glycerol-3-phosphate acyltransferase [Lachnospiraceae bacterium]